MEKVYTWKQIEAAIEAHGAKLIKQIEAQQTPIAQGVPDLSLKTRLVAQINVATESVKKNIKDFLENPEVNHEG